MINSIQLSNGKEIFITQEEADFVSTSLLAGHMFFRVDRLKKVFNSSDILNCGPSQMFLDPLVRDGEFSFSESKVYAKKDDKEYVYDGWWKESRGDFELGTMDFNQFITYSTV